MAVLHASKLRQARQKTTVMRVDANKNKRRKPIIIMFISVQAQGATAAKIQSAVTDGLAP